MKKSLLGGKHSDFCAGITSRREALLIGEKQHHLYLFKVEQILNKVKEFPHRT